MNNLLISHFFHDLLSQNCQIYFFRILIESKPVWSSISYSHPHLNYQKFIYMQKNFIFLIFIHYFLYDFIVISLFPSEFLPFSSSFLKEAIYKPSFFLPFSLKTLIFLL